MGSRRADRCAQFVLSFGLWFACGAAEARDKTDVITLQNGDRVTGEIGEETTSSDDYGITTSVGYSF